MFPERPAVVVSIIFHGRYYLYIRELRRTDDDDDDDEISRSGEEDAEHVLDGPPTHRAGVRRAGARRAEADVPTGQSQGQVVFGLFRVVPIVSFCVDYPLACLELKTKRNVSSTACWLARKKLPKTRQLGVDHPWRRRRTLHGSQIEVTDSYHTLGASSN